MKAGERIRLIKEAAQSLVDRPWPEIQLILGEHGAQTYEIQSGFGPPDELTYCYQQIQGLDDESLTDLHEYLAGSDAATPKAPPEEIWGQLPARVFLSHVHAERTFVAEVKAVLASRYGIDAFVAHDDIHPSKSWRNTIKGALNSCDYFAAFVHPEFHTSQWCDQEVGWALARDLPILPIRPVGFDRSQARDGFLEEHQDIALDSATGTVSWWVADQIFQGLYRHSATRGVAVRALVEAFVTSWSFDTTRRFWALIEQQSNLDSQQLRRLEYAVQTNDQVYNAVAGTEGTPVPELVKALIDRFEPPMTDPWGGDEPPF